MSLFMCRQCGCIENTACCHYWGDTADGDPPVCSECDPYIGKWHNRFPKRSAVGMLVDQSGNLWSKAQVDGGMLPAHYTIVGEVF
jgi:hypothetical protein